LAAFGVFRTALLGAICLSLVNCSAPPKPPIVPDRVILVTIDTLRADHLASFGYPIDTMPFVDGLGGRGSSFKRAFAHSSTTGPSHSSMFTGLYPLQHRVRDNTNILDTEFITLAERMAEAGFRTAAFVSGMAHFGRSKIAQGFQDYDQPLEEEMRDETGGGILYRRAELTTDRVIEWLSSVGDDDRFFLWVHYFDPHNPLSTGEPFLGRVTPADGEPREEFLAYLEHVHRSDLTTRRKIVADIHSYDAELLYLDEQIARLFSAYEDMGIGSESLWIITSDHGQGLANHDHWSHHVQIYNVHLHVPLIFFASDDSLAAGEIDGHIVEHVDIPITILDLLGLDLSGQKLPLQGKSLVPLLKGETQHQHKPYSFAERRRYYSDRPMMEPGERLSLQTLRYKYIWFTEGQDEFYDLINDPYETTNLINEPIPEREDLRLALEQMVEALMTGERAEEIVDEETLRRLRALGYIQ
jgi:arylsulfatase A-like enzyme